VRIEQHLTSSRPYSTISAGRKWVCMAGNQEVLVVVGAGSGMGQECALFLAGKGYRVIGSVYLEKEQDDLAKAAAARAVTIETVRMDVTKPDQVKATIQQIGRVDGLVYFAGISLRGFVEDLTMEDIKKVFEVNYYGALHCIQAVLPGMRAQKSGRLVITTSAGGRIGSMSIGGYVSSKFAVEGLVECLAQEVAMFNIHCSLVEPGLIKTPHFTVHRNRAPRAMSPESPYYQWFLQHEKMVDDILEGNSFSVDHVAKVVYKILTAKHPKLRYLVGAKAALVVNLRRYVPGEIFQRIHWRVVRKIITQPKVKATTLSGVAPKQP
jgi:NAD(P)-dependent dehydrogenase (short-subunit alcohol dehydrogenase family)